MKKKPIILLLFSLVLTFGVSYIASIFTETDIHSWYKTLKRPHWTPPNYVFSIVWPILYLMIAISLWIIVLIPKKVKKKRALISFAFQLFLNGTWTFAFFYLHSPLLGLIHIFLLLGAILWNLSEFYALSKLSGILLIPYLLWVAYATSLNLGFWYLNK